MPPLRGMLSCGVSSTLRVPSHGSRREEKKKACVSNVILDL